MRILVEGFLRRELLRWAGKRKQRMQCLDTGGASRQAERGQSGLEVGFAEIVKPYDEEEDGNAEKAGGDFAAFLGLVVPVHNCPAVKIGKKSVK